MDEKIMTEVRVSYDFANYPTLDEVANAAAGREPDFSGTAPRAGWRELGWICDELSAARMVRSLKAVGLNPQTKSVTVTPHG